MSFASRAGAVMQIQSFKVLPSLVLLSLATSLTATEPVKPATPAGTVTAPAPATTLSLVGEGIRQKKVFIISVNVYKAQFLVSDKAMFVSSLATMSPLDALAKMETAELRMSFMRDVSPAQIKESFGDALDANKVNRQSPNMAAFLKKVEESPAFDKGKSVTINANLKTGNLRYIDTAGKATNMKVSAQDIRDLFSIWLGNPADGGLETLKKALLGKA